jgi:plasmid stability protein
MATLNIKDFPTPLYRRIQARARKHRRSVAQEITAMLEESMRETEHSLMELKGLGKHLWKDIDVDRYLEEERKSWD